MMTSNVLVCVGFFIVLSEGASFDHGFRIVHRPRSGHRGHPNPCPSDAPTLCVRVHYKMDDAELAIYLIFIFGEINKSVPALPFVSAIHVLTSCKVQQRVGPLSAKHLKSPRKDVKRSTMLTSRSPPTVNYLWQCSKQGSLHIQAKR